MDLRKWYLFLVYFCYCIGATAQDINFTQQYANRLSLNPALAGLNHNWSITVSHRNQWPALNGSFITNQLAADYSFPDKKSAIAITMQQDRAGIGGLQKLLASAGYAYHTELTDKISLSGGLQASVASLRVNYDNLVFGDQLSNNGIIALNSAEANNFEPFTYGSVTAGGLIFTDQLWLGIAASHLNKPSYGLKETTRLPIRYTANAGYKFYIASYETNKKIMELSISPTVTYIQQKDFSWVSAGIYTKYTPLTFGLIYKGIPVFSDADQDRALAVIAGLQLNQIEIGFSHDVGLAGLSKYNGGANEVSLTFKDLSFNRSSKGNNRSKFNRSLFCPAF
jgi:type IX secretion system PorP/SprF family membrane protein